MGARLCTVAEEGSGPSGDDGKGEGARSFDDRGSARVVWCAGQDGFAECKAHGVGRPGWQRRPK